MRAVLATSALILTVIVAPASGQIFDATFNELAPGFALTQPFDDPHPLARPTNVVLDFPSGGDTIDIVTSAGDLTDQPVLLQAQAGGIAWGAFLTPSVYSTGTFSVSWDSLVMSLPENETPKPLQAVQLVSRTGDPASPGTLQIEEKWQLRYTADATFEISDLEGIRTVGSFTPGQADHFDLEFNLSTGAWDLGLNGGNLASGTVLPPFEFGGVAFTTNGRGRTSDPAALAIDNLIVEADGIAGDYNGNGLVEQGDLDFVLLHWGRTTPPVPSGWIVDMPNGLIDQGELDTVLLNWGNSAGDTTTPEPSTVAMVAVLACLAVAWRGRRKRLARG